MRGSVGPQHRAPVPCLARLEKVLLSFSGLADYSGTTPALALLISHSAEHRQWYLPARDVLWKQNTDPCPSRVNQYTFHQFWKGLCWVLSSQCVRCMLKRKTGIFQVYLLLLSYPEALRRRISPFPNRAGGRNVITVAFSTENLLKAFPFLGTMVCISL